MTLKTHRPFAATCGVATMLVLAGAGALLLTHPANATAAFAAANGNELPK